MSATNKIPVIRIAGPADVDVVTEFSLGMASDSEGNIGDQSLAFTGVKKTLSSFAYGIYYLLEVNNQAVAMAAVQKQWIPFQNSYSHRIQTVFVRREHRRKGYFRMLYQHIRNEALKQGAWSLSLYADKDNEPAKRAYRNCGMKEICKVHGVGDVA